MHDFGIVLSLLFIFTLPIFVAFYKINYDRYVIYHKSNKIKDPLIIFNIGNV